LSDLELRCESELDCQRRMVADPKWPSESAAEVRKQAFTSTYLVWAFYALDQDEPELAERWLRAAAKLNPALVEGAPSMLVHRMVSRATYDETIDHEAKLRDYACRMPPELAPSAEDLAWAAGRGYLRKAAQALIWDRIEDGERWIGSARAANAALDEGFIEWLCYEVDGRRLAYGEEAAEEALRRLAAALRPLSGEHSRRLVARYNINRLFESRPDESLQSVLSRFQAAVVNEPRWLWNRGSLSKVGRRILQGPLHAPDSKVS
jgi:hypothetical protein